MPQENVELVRRIYAEGLLDGDPARLLELMAPDVEYVNPPEAVDPGTRSGREEVAKALTALGDFAWMANDLHELFDAGDSVVAHVTFRARGRGSEHQITQEEAHTWTFRGGLIVRLEWGRDLAAALRAVESEDLGDTGRTMARGNIDVVLGLYAALDTGAPAEDLTDELLATTFDPGVEVDQLGELAGTSGRFHGYEGLRSARRELDDALAVNRWELLEHRAEGDLVACRVRATAAGRTSGAPVELEVGHLFTMHGGRIARWEVHRDPTRAFEALGE